MTYENDGTIITQISRVLPPKTSKYLINEIFDPRYATINNIRKI